MLLLESLPLPLLLVQGTAVLYRCRWLVVVHSGSSAWLGTDETHLADTLPVEKWRRTERLSFGSLETFNSIYLWSTRRTQSVSNSLVALSST
eukprot:SAG11_NODE_1298_length_5265_cov_3.096787_4_plen_92_part_00